MKHAAKPAPSMFSQKFSADGARRPRVLAINSRSMAGYRADSYGTHQSSATKNHQRGSARTFSPRNVPPPPQSE